MTPGAMNALDRADGRSLRSGFLRNVQERPDRPALAVGNATLSYSELDAAARVWASALAKLSASPPQRVGIMAARSEVAYTATLAALYSGAAFVPLNPTFPASRTARMIDAAQLDVIVVDRGATAHYAEASALVTVEAPPMLAPAHDTWDATPQRAWTRKDIEGLTPAGDLPPVLPADTAYLLFTSGSTGLPKGVPVAHSNVLHFIDVVSARYGITDHDRFSQTFDQTFDLSVFDIFVAWENGACLCAMQPLDLLAPGRFIQRQGVTVWFSVPSLPALLRKKNLLKPDAFPTLRWSLFCGEPLPRVTAELWQAAAPDSVVENLYGPTELTIACLVHRWNRERSPEMCVNEVVPIGRPYPGLGALVMGEDGKPVARGESGELWVCGPQTVPGYWRNPRQTSERFVEVPGPGDLVTRFYRTGDRVRQLAEGDYVYLGRVDHQIKVMGHRVELGEIEAVLMRQDGVAQAAAIGWPVVDGSAEGIVAFVTGTITDVQEVRNAARVALPDYMAPRTVELLEQMPLNANGKIDRAVLQARLEGTRA